CNTHFLPDLPNASAFLPSPPGGKGSGVRGRISRRWEGHPSPPQGRGEQDTQAALSAAADSVTSTRLLGHRPRDLPGPAGRSSGMRNFLRAVRCAWPYRNRLILSIAAALAAA